jgi:peptidoglycan glycosyltransferase
LWLTYAFTGLALLQLALVNNNLSLATFAPLLALILCSGVAFYLLQVHGQQPAGDPLLLPLTYFLAGLGLVLITRLAPTFVLRQLFWLVIATVLLLLVTLLPKNLNWLRRYKYTWLIGGLLLLASTLLFGVNPSGFGARLWLQVGGIFFQPSELLKLLLIVFLAAYMADRRRELIEVKAYIGPVPIPHPSYWGPMLLMWGFSMVLLIWQRDLGAALLFFGVFISMVYAVTGQSRYVWAGALLLMMATILGYYLFDVVRLRVEGFLNPWLDPSGRSFQIAQSLLAFASGGIFGQGLGQGLPTAIPVVHTDFVYAAIGEEYGLLGALGVLLCFVLLVSRAFYIALRAASGFEQLLAVGIGAMFGLQTLVITAGTLKLMPLTGVTLPLVSYGGSSLVVSFLMVGLLVFVSRKEKRLEIRDWRLASVSDYALRTTHNVIPYFRLARILSMGFLIVAGGLILWQVAAAPFLTTREDNPRLVIAEQRIDRGRLLTRDGVPLAETVLDEDGFAQRHYPYPGLSTVTGYYSLRHGTGGIEAAFDPTLRGSLGQSEGQKFINDLLHRPPVGRDVTLTVDLPAQVAADFALGEQEGAVVVLDIATGAVLVMSSHPTYDPNTLDEQWDSLRQDEQAPLLNRATQGLFPVGDLARLIGLIGLYEAGATAPADPLDAPLEATLAPLGPTGYLATAQQLGLIRPLPGLRSQPGRLPNFDDKGTVKDLAVTPLHLARVLAGLALDGQLPTPILALNGEPHRAPAMQPTTARAVRALLPQVDTHLIGLSGQATPAETGQRSLSWFVGLAPAEAVEAEAKVKADLILDPSQIIPATPTPSVSAANPPARYAVVAVVVTDTPQDNPAARIAAAPVRVLLQDLIGN